MLDPIVALGIAGNCIYNGILKENIDLEIVIEDLAVVARKLEMLNATTTGHNGLDDLCQRCGKTAGELLAALYGFKTRGQKSKVQSVRMALKAIWGKKGVEEMRTRLEEFRDELQFHVLVSLKCEIDVEDTKRLERFKTLDAHANTIFDALSEQQVSIQANDARSDKRHIKTVAIIVSKQKEGHTQVVKSVAEAGDQVVQAVAASAEAIQETLSAESIKADNRHQHTAEVIVAKQIKAHTEVIETLQSLNCSSRAEQEATRRELEQLKQALTKTEQDIETRVEELKEFVEALNRTRDDKLRRQLQERSNAITVALSAMAIVHESLQCKISSVQAYAKRMMISANLSSWSLKPQAPQLHSDCVWAKELESAEVHELPAIEPVGSELNTPMESRMREEDWPVSTLPLSPLPLLCAMTEMRDARAGNMSPRHDTFYHP
ncbi:hypothetical protein V8E51_013090 [Hyaloscypha variabilis]